MRNNNPGDGGNEKFIRDLAQAQLTEWMLLVEGQEKLYGKPFADALLHTYLTSLVSTMTYNALRDGEYDQALMPEAEGVQDAELRRLIDSVRAAVKGGLESGIATFDADAFPEFEVSITRTSVADPAPPTGRDSSDQDG